jgi:hypothetical protein
VFDYAVAHGFSVNAVQFFETSDCVALYCAAAG